MARSAVGDTVLNEYRFNIDNVSLDALKDQGFNPRAPVTFLIHGFTSGYPLQAWMTGIVDIYTINERKNPNKQLASQNLFVVNWHYGARSINYPRAVANVPIVSAYLVKFIDRLVAELGVNSRQIQLVGHSLGAHLAGFTGKNTKSRLGRIYGLDPAGPCFGTLFGKLGYLSFYPTSQRLAPTDAEEVITVVTNTELLGLDANLGQYSVFVEGGKTQPGCTGGAPGLIKSLETFTLEGGDAGAIACSHSRAPMLMAYRHHQGTGDNDDNDCQMVAYECDNWDNFKHGHCGYCDEQNSQCLLVGLNWQYPNKTSAQFGSSSSGAHAGGNSNYESGYNHQNNNNNYQNNNNNYQNNNNNNYQNNNNNHNNHNNYDHGSNQQSSYGDNQQSGYGQSTSASNSNYANNNNNNNNNNNHAYGHSSSTGGHAGSQANHQGRQPNTGYNHGQSSGGSHTSHSGFNSNYGSNYGQSNNQNHGQYGQQSGHGHQSGVSPHSSASGNNYDQQGSSASNNNYGLNQANQNHNQHNHNQNGYSQHQGYGQDSEQYQGGTHTMTKRDLFSSIVKPVAGAILKPASVLKPLTGSGTSVPSFLGGGNNKHDRESTMDATYDQHKKQDQQPGGGNSNQKHNQSGGFGNGNANHNQNHNDYNNNNNYGNSNNQGNSNNHGYNDNNNNNNYGNNNNNNNNYGNNNNNNNNNYGNNNNLLPNEKQPAINGNEPAVEGASKRPEGKMRMFLKTGETQPYCSYQYQLIMDLHSPFDTPLKPQLSLVLQDEQPRDMEAINGNSRQQEMESVRTDKNSLSTEEFGYKVNDLRYTLLLTTVNKVRKITKGTLLSLDGIDPSKIKQLRINYMSNIDYRKRQEYSSTLCVVQTTNDKPKEQTGLNPLHINNSKDRVKQNRVYFGECNSSPSQQS